MIREKRLDERQEAAVNARGGALLVVAGAGSGKTRTIIERADALLGDANDALDAERLLMLTFSRKACREISTRLKQRRPPPLPAPAVQTYHAYGYQLLREAPGLCRRRDHPTLLDEADQKRLFQAALRDEGVTGDALRAARSSYDLARNHGCDPEDERHHDGILRHWLDNGAAPLAQAFLAGFAVYERRKRAANVVDFHDLAVLPMHALRDHPEWCSEIAGRYGEIIVDEAQDTNLVQYRLLYLLGKAGVGTITMVGDDDQTIYGWRGAAPDNLRRFQRDFQPRVIHLDRNYRSTEAIVHSAGALIAHNTRRVAKTTQTATGGGETPTLYTHAEGKAMAEAIAETIQQRIEAGATPGEHAVLYRVNRLSTLIEPAFIARGIPYQVQKGTELYRRQELQMLFAAIRLAINPDDTPAFRKLSGLVDGFGEKRLAAAIAAHEDSPSGHSPGLLAIAAQQTANAAPGPQWRLLCDAVAVLQQTPPGQMDLVQDWVMGVEPYTRWLEKLAGRAERPSEAIAQRLEHITLFDRAIQAHTATAVAPGVSPIAQWQGVMELTLSAPTEAMAEEAAVTLSTIHRAKGLEWQNVHVFGFSDGLIPAVQDVMDPDEGTEDLEEERRLAYVAITRAQHELTLHHAPFIRLPGQDRQCRLSRFAEEAGLAPQRHPSRVQPEPTANAGANPFMAAMGRSSAPQP